jgi:gliding motility-associated-like protein
MITVMKKNFSILLLFLHFYSAYSQKVCSDTSRRILFSGKGDTSLQIIFGEGLVSEENILLGYLYIESQPISQGVSCIIKTDKNNDVIWCKRLSQVSNTISFTELLVLNNGTICVAANIKNIGSIVSRWLLFFDENGNYINSLQLSFDVPNKIIDEFKITETKDGKIIAMAAFDSYNLPSGGVRDWFVLVKLNQNGTTEWSTAYETTTGFRGIKLVEHSDAIYLCGRYTRATVENYNVYGYQLLKLNSWNGNLITAKTIFYPGKHTSGYVYGFSGKPSLKKINNNRFNYFLQGGTDSDTATTFIQFDTSINITGSKFQKFKNQNWDKNIYTTFNESGNLIITSSNITNDRKIMMFYADSNFQLIEQKEYQFNSAITPSFSYNYLPPICITKKDRYQLYSRNFTGTKFQVELAQSVLKTAPNECVTKDIDSVYFEDFIFTEDVFQFHSQKYNVAQLSVANFSIQNASLLKTEACVSVTKKELICSEDFSICNGDTAYITSNSGFLHYNWLNSYNTKIINDSTIKVWPQIDTFYVVTVKTGSNCILNDTVFVKVHQPKLLNLGTDTSICKGDSLRITASQSFTHFLWNTGESTNQITIKQKGVYSIRATDINGCISSDTLEVITRDTPAINIASSPVLCINQNDTLDPGDYKSYKWQDGSTTRIYKVTEKGLYSVRVTDEYGCSGTGSVEIISLKQAPQNYLPEDSTICKRQTIEIKSDIPDATNYLWSSGNTTSSLFVSQPGVYTLKITDKDKCIGYDSINIKSKECLNKLVFPNAFTPDNNGINDTFRPVVEGNIISYQLIIYNRWGQQLFYSNNPLVGWDGNYKNLPQPSGNFVWQCVYKFYDEPQKTLQGSVVLIR